MKSEELQSRVEENMETIDEQELAEIAGGAELIRIVTDGAPVVPIKGGVRGPRILPQDPYADYISVSEAVTNRTAMNPAILEQANVLLSR